jgi:toxin ParE1/3/4
MEKRKGVQLSSQCERDIQNIFVNGVETFGINAAEQYKQHIVSLAYGLNDFYLMYPECKWVLTQSRIYRNIILESHLIIYRICSEKIEVLRVLHSKSSISRIRSVGKIKIE